MRKLLLAAFLFCPSVHAQAVAIEELFAVNSLAPQALIPFKVKGDAMTGGGYIENIELTNSLNVDCRTMRDPFIAEVFHLKCVDETDVNLKITVLKNGGRHILTFGPVLIRKPDPNLVVIKPPSTDPAVIAGKQMYGLYCVGCHSAPAVLAGRTPAQIRSAVFNNPSMGAQLRTINLDLKTILKDDHYAKLAAYLKTL